MPEYRCRGYGSALVNRVADEARQLAVQDLTLYTPDQERFYARLGWFVLERCRYRTQRVAAMRLRLAS